MATLISASQEQKYGRKPTATTFGSGAGAGGGGAPFAYPNVSAFPAGGPEPVNVNTTRRPSLSTPSAASSAVVVTVHSVSQLHNPSTFGSLDAYIEIQCGRSKRRTRVERATDRGSAHWEQALHFPLYSTRKITVTAYSENTFSSDTMIGSVNIPIDSSTVTARQAYQISKPGQGYRSRGSVIISIQPKTGSIRAPAPGSAPAAVPAPYRAPAMVVQPTPYPPAPSAPRVAAPPYAAPPPAYTPPAMPYPNVAQQPAMPSGDFMDDLTPEERAFIGGADIPSRQRLAGVGHNILNSIGPTQAGIAFMVEKNARQDVNSDAALARRLFEEEQRRALEQAQASARSRAAEEERRRQQRELRALEEEHRRMHLQMLADDEALARRLAAQMAEEEREAIRQMEAQARADAEYARRLQQQMSSSNATEQQRRRSALADQSRADAEYARRLGSPGT